MWPSQSPLRRHSRPLRKGTRTHVVESSRETQNMLVFNLYFQSQAISFLFVTKVLNKHGQKRGADICQHCAFSRRLHNSITNTPVHRHQADNSQESPLHHRCTTFLFHIKMINAQKARPSVDVTHSDTPRSLLLRPDWSPALLGGRGSLAPRQPMDRTSGMWRGRPRAPSSPAPS